MADAELKDVVKDQTTTTGTGTVTVDGVAPTGFRTITAAHTSGATVHYRIHNADQTEWENGEGVWTSGANTLTRATVYESSNAGSLVTFSAGTKNIITGPNAADFANIARLTSAASNMTLARVAGSTYSTVQQAQDLAHSTGWFSGGAITDNTDGTISVAAGTGAIRATNSDVAQIVFTDWAASTAGNVLLTDATVNYVYVEYNAGTPRVVTTITERTTDYNTNIYIARIYRSGTALHINDKVKFDATTPTTKTTRRNQEASPFAAVSGLALAATGTRNFSVSAGNIWHGANNFQTAAFDSSNGTPSATSRFTAIYRNGSGGWTEVATQSQIDNTQYDNNSGTLATLSANLYGVHWVYLETDGDMIVVYGQGNYTLTTAQNAQPPATLPPRVSATGFIIGRIIIQKSASTFHQADSANLVLFNGSPAVDHANLTDLAWTASGHTGTVSTLAGFDGSGVAAGYTLSGTGTAIPTTVSPAFTTPTLGVASATSVNKVTVTAPATSATLTLVDGKTLTVSNTLTLAGTDSTTMTFPGTSGTVATLGLSQTFTAAQIGGVTALTSSAASIAINLATTNNFSHTLTENTTLAAPSNPVAGQSGSIVFTQHASAPKTLAYNTFWKFPGGTVPTLTATNSAVDTLVYYVESATRATCQLVKGVA